MFQMPHRKKVIWITSADNPKVKAPRYPGKFRWNNKHGVTQSKDEWLEQQTDEWLQHMLSKPAYDKTYLSDKSLVLELHLHNSLRPRRLDYPKCRKLLRAAEMRHKLGRVQEKNINDVKGNEEKRIEIVKQGSLNLGDRSQDLGEGTSGLCNLMSLEESQKSDELCSETDDEDWAPEGKRRDRTENEYEIAQILRKTDKELFEGT